MNEQFELNGNYIRDRLRQDHRKQSWLVGQLGVSQSLVDKMVGGHVPNEVVLDALVELFGCKKSDLLIPKKNSA